MQLNVSLGQMNIQCGRPKENLAKADALAGEAAARGSRLLLLPELWSSGYALEQAQALASGAGTGAAQGMAELARRHRLHVCGSILMELAPGKIGNTSLLFDAAGLLVCQYSKVHLFGPLAEDRYLHPGDRAVLVEAPWGKTGLAICYDLRFPELFRTYAVQGARVVLLVAEWPIQRLMHWQALLRARAIENQCCMIACNGAGTPNDLQLAGHSCVIDPWGEIVVEADEREGLLTAEIDLERVDEVRRKLPVLQDRRPEVYSAVSP